jgi:hypothetical protein
MKTIKTVLFAGTNAGGTAALGVLADANDRSHDTEFAIHAIDPNGENLSRFAAAAAARGVRVTTEQQPIEAALATRTDDAPLGIFIDAPESIAAALEMGARSGRPMLLYVALLLGTGDLLGLRAVLTTTTADAALQLAALFRAMSSATVRSGSDAVFGVEASPRSMSLEPLIRAWFASHMQANLYKLIYNLAPVSAPIEVTRDAKASMPLFIRDSRAGWADPGTFAAQVLERPTMPIELGTDVLIAEIGVENDVRLHEARRRRLDRQVALRNAAVPTLAGVGWPSFDAAVRRATENAISRSFPVRMTD